MRLSDASQRIDRSEKFDVYRQIAALEDYVPADQDAPAVEIFRRRTGWTRETCGMGDTCKLGSAGLELTVARTYRRVSFAQS